MTGIQLMDLETKAKLSKGYLSRQLIPPVDKLIIIAKALDTTVESLIEEDCEQQYKQAKTLAEAEKYVHALKKYMSKDEAVKLLLKAVNETYGD